ncbi:MAG: hypothetical protein ACKV2Q_35360 [Planctomycetaceae bacterium]
MLAVHVDYEKRLATIGTQHDKSVPRDELLKSLKSIGYDGTFVDEVPR